MVGYNYAPVTYNDTDHPEWADIVGWAMVVIAVVWIPIEALIAVCRYGFRGVRRSFDWRFFFFVRDIYSRTPRICVLINVIKFQILYRPF